MSFTNFPDYLIDSGELNVYELAVAMFISRKTMGWGKRTDGISRSQFVKYLGISKTTVKKAVDSLNAKGIIIVQAVVNADGSNSYSQYGFSEEIINRANGNHLDNGGGRSGDDLGVGQEMVGGRSGDDLGVGQEMTTQDKPITKETNNNKDIKKKEKRNTLKALCKKSKLSVMEKAKQEIMQETGCPKDILDSICQHRVDIGKRITTKKPLLMVLNGMMKTVKLRYADSIVDCLDFYVNETTWQQFKPQWYKNSHPDNSHFGMTDQQIVQQEMLDDRSDFVAEANKDNPFRRMERGEL